MPLSRRYHPEFDANEVCTIGMSFEYVIPPGVGITSGSTNIYTNTMPPIGADGDFGRAAGDPVQVIGRTVYIPGFTGGIPGTDYVILWFATDTDGNVCPRSALLLCALTS